MKSFRQYIKEKKHGYLKLDPKSGEDRGKLIAAAEDEKVKIKSER